MMSKVKTIQAYANLRLLIGRLGEKDNFDWWGTSALSSTGKKYHQILFPRTYGKSSALVAFKAAETYHDSGIGRSRSFHLFRLPSEIEKRVFECLNNESELSSSRSKDDCLNQLLEVGSDFKVNSQGPIRLGDLKDILKQSSIGRIASVYLHAFQTNQNCIPYFGDA